jgi:hypothetical protein
MGHDPEVPEGDAVVACPRFAFVRCQRGGDTGGFGSVLRSRTAMSGTTAVKVVLDLEKLLCSRFAADTDEDIVVRVVGVLGS